MIPAGAVLALARAERAGARLAKERARAVRRIDLAVGGGRVTELQEAARGYGVELSENAIHRARKVAQLLASLDPIDLDPPELESVHDAETLYLIQRAVEVTRQDARAVLALLNACEGDRRAYLKQMVATRSAAVKPEAAWRTPLRKAPADTVASINAGFAGMCKALDVSPVLGMNVLGRILNTLDAPAWQRLHALADALNPEPLTEPGA